MRRKATDPIWTAGLPNQMKKKQGYKVTRLQGCKDKFSFASLLFCFFILSSQLSAFSSQLSAPSDYDSLIVHPKTRVIKSNRLSRLMYRYGFQKYQVVKEGIYVIPLDGVTSNKEKELKIQKLKQSGLFDLVEPDYKFSLDQNTSEKNYIKIIRHNLNDNLVDSENIVEVTPNDKDFQAQYYLKEINVTKAWRTTTGDSLLIGVLDTGADANHPDLEGKVIDGEFNQDLNDEIGHGTAVSGIISANTNNNQGIAGVTWNAKILSLKVTDDNGVARVSTVVSALNKAYDKGAMIVQISLSTNQFSQTLKNAIKEAQDKNILIISSAGNTGVKEPRYPAAFNGVLGIGATDETKEVASYSTRGEHVSLVAPGNLIYTTSPNSKYESVSGTSFAAPQVAGAAALVWSIAPVLTNTEIRDLLINSAEDKGVPGKDDEYGYGILNTEKAVELAKAKLNASTQNTNQIEIEKWIIRN